MPYDEPLAERLRDALAGEPDVEERRMFGGVAFLAGGHLAVCASGQGGLMARVDPERTEDLLAEEGAAPMVMQGRETRGWVRVAGEAVADDATLDAWVGRGLAFARSLPPKA